MHVKNVWGGIDITLCLSPSEAYSKGAPPYFASDNLIPHSLGKMHVCQKGDLET